MISKARVTSFERDEKTSSCVATGAAGHFIVAKRRQAVH